MEFMTGTQQKTASAADLKGGSFLNQTVCVHGAVHAIRAMGAIEFVTLRLRDGALQCVVDEAHEQLLEGVSQECAVVATGTLTADERAPMGVELHLEELEVLSSPKEPISVPVDKYKMHLNLDTELPLRPVALRNLRKRAVFKIQEAVGRAFREEMFAQGLHRDPHPQDRPCRSRGRQQHLPHGILRQEGIFDPVPPVLQADDGGRL